MASNIASVKTQKRGDETKRSLVEATKTLLSTNDYQSITLDQISAAVGVAKSSILWHFESKEGLLTEAVFDLFEEIDEKLQQEQSDLETQTERLEFLLGAVGDYFEGNPGAKGIVITLLLNSGVPPKIHERIREQWQQHIQEIQNFLRIGDDSVSEVRATAILAFMQGIYLHWYLKGCPPGMKQYMVDTFQALVGADEVLPSAD